MLFCLILRQGKARVSITKGKKGATENVQEPLV